MSVLTRVSLEGLAQRVAEAGINADPAGLAQLAEVGAESGVSPVVLAVLTDDREPEVARLRAFERVSCAVSRMARSHALAA